QGPARCVVFSPDGKYFASGSADQTVRLWDARTGKQSRQLNTNEPVVSLAFSADSQVLAAGTSYGSVHIWGTAKGQVLRVIEAHKGLINALAFTLDGKALASAATDKTIRLWDITPARNPQFAPYLLSAIPWGRRPGFVPILQTIEYVRLNRAMREFQGHQAEIKAIAFSQDGKTLASGGLDHTLRLWETATGKTLSQCQGHLGEIFSLAFSPDRKTLGSGDSKCAIRLWDFTSAK